MRPVDSRQLPAGKGRAIIRGDKPGRGHGGDAAQFKPLQTSGDPNSLHPAGR